MSPLDLFGGAGHCWDEFLFERESAMGVETILGLMRLANEGDKVIADLARMILGLIEGSREFEARAGLAEAALEAEKARVAELEAELDRLTARRSAAPVLALVG